ncbi:hypothetical protein D3C73_1389770 [compost metagenome]
MMIIALNGVDDAQIALIREGVDFETVHVFHDGVPDQMVVALCQRGFHQIEKELLLQQEHFHGDLAAFETARMILNVLNLPQRIQ